jgi:arabinofuranosyltransferase
MKKMKIPIKKKRTKRDDFKKYDFDSPFRPNRTLKIIFNVVIVLLPVFLAFVYYRFAINQNKVRSFPLDDPWIHLTFAKNIFEYFSFSFFKNEMVTAGSTSPLFTILEAVGFFFTTNEMLIGYAMGVLFFVLSAYAFYRLSVLEFGKEIIFALLTAGIFIIDKWIVFISLSGMETTMFIFILVLASFFYKKRMALPLGTMLGLLLWTRPDGVAFIGAIIIDYALIRTYSKNQLDLQLFTGKDFRKIILSFALVAGLYIVLNYVLSGSFLPNTYNAKLTYYSPEFRSRWDFLQYEVWEYFKTGAYYVLMIGFLYSVGKLIYDLYTKTYNQNTLYIVFILLFVLMYFIKLPYAHRFGRYMMPLIPFFILVATVGFRDIARIINKYTTNALFSKSIFYILIGITYFIGVKNYDENREQYALQCKYIYDRQVMAAQWLNKYTKEDDIVATHDVGAIGYYSNRKIVDVAGLVTPELIGKINDLSYVSYLQTYMKEKGVTYLAFLREWYRVSNQNPLFTTANSLPPEVMDVYKFVPGETEILSKEGNSLIEMMTKLVSQKAAQQIVYLGNRLLAIEPRSSLAYYYMAYAYQLLKDNANYERSMQKAMELFPDFKDAHLYYGEYLKNEKRLEEAKIHYEKTLQLGTCKCAGG